VVGSLRAAEAVYRDLGFTEDSNVSGTRSENRDAVVVSWRAEGGAPVEVVLPTSGTSWFRERLRGAGPGLAFVGYVVDDLEHARGWLDAQETWWWSEPGGSHEPPALWVHPRSTDGLAVRLTQDD
jgi:hypothetical protein